MFEGLSGAGLAAAVAAVDVSGLDAAAALEYALAADRVASWAGAVEAAGLARMQRAYPELDLDSGVGSDVHALDMERLVVTEVRASYGCSQVAASIRLGFADALGALPGVAEALRAGWVDLPRARALVRETGSLVAKPVLRARVADHVLAAHAAARADGGSGLTVAQWVRRIRRAVLEIDPAEAERAATSTRADRRVWHEADIAAGSGVFGLAGPVAQTAACHAAVDGLARDWRAQGRAGTLAQLRFDAAFFLLTSRPAGNAGGTGADAGEDAAEAPHGHRCPAGMVLGQVTIPLSSLVGVDDAPGELSGVGPISAGVGRELMARARLWQRLLTDPVDGHVVVQEIKRYRPSAAMRRFVLARAGGTCTARGCGRRTGLQIDHVVPAPHGPTSATNLDPQCGSDHNGKTHGGWIHVLDPETGALTQISPLGRVYTSVPTPPVGPTGCRADPIDAEHGVPPEDWDESIDPLTGAEAYPPVGKPPPDPAHDEEAGPPDPAAGADRWPVIAARITRLRGGASARVAAQTQAADRALLQRLDTELEASTDHALIAALNAEQLTEDQDHHPDQLPHPDDSAALDALLAELESAA